jgi:hypothetical protein
MTAVIESSIFSAADRERAIERLTAIAFYHGAKLGAKAVNPLSKVNPVLRIYVGILKMRGIGLGFAAGVI